MVMKDIINREIIIEELADMLKQFDIDRNSYQTDVYMYVDEDGNASLDTFTNVGGNSWLDDDHYCIYNDKEHYEGVLDVFQTIEEFANALEISVEELIKKTAEYREIDIEDVDYYEVQIYVNEEHIKKITEAYEEYYLDEIDYMSAAEEIFSKWESQQEMCESLSED